LEKLRDLLATRKALALVGASASAGIYPLLGELLKGLVRRTVNDGYAGTAEAEHWLDARTDPLEAIAGRLVAIPRELRVQSRPLGIQDASRLCHPEPEDF
jgi:hypothetical protein